MVEGEKPEDDFRDAGRHERDDVLYVEKMM